MKDALGHGSNPQGGVVPDSRLHRFVDAAGSDVSDRLNWMGHTDIAAARTLGNGHPKSDAVPVAFGHRRVLASDPVHRTSPIDGQYFKRG